MKRRFVIVSILCIAYFVSIGQTRSYADATNGLNVANPPNSLTLPGCSDLADTAFWYAIFNGYGYYQALLISGSVYDDCMNGVVKPN